jgi:hypothetical protein
MRPNLFPKAGVGPLFIGLILLLSQGPVFGADRPPLPEKTIVLDESHIKGADSVAKQTGTAHPNEALPGLSLPLFWEGEEIGGELNIAEEIFRQLTQPNPSFFKEDPLKGSELKKGEKHGNR